MDPHARDAAGDIALIGDSPAAVRLRADIQIAARSHAKVLITGETGVGKEVASHLVHRLSSRASYPFVALNCASLPDTLLESELFGHTRGSFTGAYRDKIGLAMSAHRGTLFLDEIGEMSPRMQALLLRFAESGEIRRVGADGLDGQSDVRLIAATHRDLAARVADGHFRSDLYYRLNVMTLHVAPLRERGEDVLLLLEHFLTAGAQPARSAAPTLTGPARDALLAYRWPGNARELRNVAERILARPVQTPVDVDDLPPEIAARARAQASPPSVAPPDAPRAAADEAWDRMCLERASFWAAVHEPFLHRDLTRADVRAILARGLRQTRGSYRALTALFHMAPGDYRRFIAFLEEYDCHVASASFRKAARLASRV